MIPHLFKFIIKKKNNIAIILYIDICNYKLTSFVFCYRGLFRFPMLVEHQKSLKWTLQQSMRIDCAANYLTASLPLPVSEALGVVELHLNDRGCTGRRSATHWSVKTHFTSCGSTSRIDGRITTYSNEVTPI